jgi:sugar phosphate isomerase/epimerase
MRFGWCATPADAELISRIGYDFIELPLAPLGLEHRDSFNAAKASVSHLPLPPSAFNVFFPRDMRVVGEQIDAPRVKAYLARASDLMNRAGAEIVVFGSGWARNIPEGWERSRGEDQFLTALSWCADALEGSGVTLVIEPLNCKESNIANSVQEGVRFAEQVNRKQIKVLADFYHMDEENEPLETLRVHGAWLAHIHVADSGRKNPGSGSYDYAAFFGHLKAIGYNDMVSAECSVDDPDGGRRQSLDFMRATWLSAQPG